MINLIKCLPLPLFLMLIMLSSCKENSVSTESKKVESITIAESQQEVHFQLSDEMQRKLKKQNDEEKLFLVISYHLDIKDGLFKPFFQKIKKNIKSSNLEDNKKKELLGEIDYVLKDEEKYLKIFETALSNYKQTKILTTESVESVEKIFLLLEKTNVYH